MLNPQQAARVRKLHEKQFNVNDIVHLTGFDRMEVRGLIHGDDGDFNRTVADMLKRVPSWWERSAEEYRRCVLANFQGTV